MPEEWPAIALVDQTAEVYRMLQTNNKADEDLRLFWVNLRGLSFWFKDNYKAAILKHIAQQNGVDRMGLQEHASTGPRSNQYN